MNMIITEREYRQYKKLRDDFNKYVDEVLRIEIKHLKKEFSFLCKMVYIGIGVFLGMGLMMFILYMGGFR